MTSTKTLTAHDSFILHKLSDPEASPSPLLLDPSLPPDPHITLPTTYKQIVTIELSIITKIQKLELSIATSPTATPSEAHISSYLSLIDDLSTLIEAHPNYASARNNRAQALRRVYGDGILVSQPTNSPSLALIPLPSASTLLSTSTLILTDLSTCISLLSPPSPFLPLSPQSAKTLSQAYTQRGAIYHLTSKALSAPGAELCIESGRKESSWGVLQFEEAASADFMMGGRYGNEVARGLGVVTNPTAKLCGEMVREAMRREGVCDLQEE